MNNESFIVPCISCRSSHVAEKCHPCDTTLTQGKCQTCGTVGPPSVSGQAIRFWNNYMRRQALAL